MRIVFCAFILLSLGSSAQTIINPVSATASSSTPDTLPTNVFDGNLSTVWNSGTGAPSWIQFDLGNNYAVSKIRLNVAQTPAGMTTHQVFAGPSSDNLTLVDTLTELTQDGQWIEFSHAIVGARYIKILTTSTFSWVAWREIQIYSGYLPRIGICGHPAQFCDSHGAVFQPTGMNYTQTKMIYWPVFGRSGTSHATLLVNNYNPQTVQQAFAQLHHDGYKYVRVFINYDSYGTGTTDGTPYYGIGGPPLCSDGQPQTPFTCVPATEFVNGLYQPYLDNFISMLQIANANGIYVLPTLDYLPQNCYYGCSPSFSFPKDSNGNDLIASINAYYMVQGYIDAKANYVSNFMNYVKTVDPNLLSVVIGIDFENEVNIGTTDPPFTRRDLVPTADGGTYNMSLDGDRQQAVDANIVHWANTVMSALQSVDPAAMGTSSVFPFAAVGLPAGPNGVHAAPGSNSDPRYPARPLILSLYSTLSFIDIHVYPLNGAPYSVVGQGAPFTLDGYLNSSEFSSIDVMYKPLWLGEFGAFKNVFVDVTHAAYGVQDFKNACIAKGFKGWAFWTWDNFDQTELYSAVDNEGAINGALAPLVWNF